MLHLAAIHARAIKRSAIYGLREIKLSLMSLRKRVRDYEPAFDFFFHVIQRGFHTEAQSDISTVIPRPINLQTQINEIDYSPPDLPEDGVVSKCYIKCDLSIIDRLEKDGRLDLIPEVKWLIANGPEINFWFQKCGDLQCRDTSVWPICAIENWPNWVRSELFGNQIDIKSAYLQFLYQNLNQKFSKDKLFLYYPAVVLLLQDPNCVRLEIANIMKVSYDQYKKEIKSLLMAIIMGSNFSAAMIKGRITNSKVVDIILSIIKPTDHEIIDNLCEYLDKFATQLNIARKSTNSTMPLYMIWEREKRYAMWEYVGRVGIMMHDGIDGIPEEFMSKFDEISKFINADVA